MQLFGDKDYRFHSELKTFWGISHLPVNALIDLYFKYLFC